MMWAEKYLGLPFKERGLDRTGVDCWGLVRLILLEQKGIKLPAYPEIEPGASMDKVEEIQSAINGTSWQAIDMGKEQTFDCVLMSGLVRADERAFSRPVHIGCVINPGTLIHIELGCDVSVVNYLQHPRVKRRVKGFYRTVI